VTTILRDRIIGRFGQGQRGVQLDTGMTTWPARTARVFLIRERLRVGVHLSFCASCSNFSPQLRLPRTAVRRLLETDGQ
jgi:hypothetical protein